MIRRVRGRDGRPQLGGIEVVLAIGVRAQQDRHGTRSGQRDAGLVAVVHRLEDDDLVAVVEQPEQRAGQRLGGAGGDEHLGVGIVLEAVEAPLVAGHGLAQHGQAGSRRVLVDARADGIDRSVEHLWRDRRCPGSPDRG